MLISCAVILRLLHPSVLKSDSLFNCCEFSLQVGFFFLVRLFKLIGFLLYISGIPLNFVHSSTVNTVSGFIACRFFTVIKSPWEVPVIYRFCELQEKVKASSHTQLAWHIFKKLFCLGISRLWEILTSWMNKCIINMQQIN